jgi:hypothetical protein
VEVIETRNFDIEDASTYFLKNTKVSNIVISFTTMPQRLQSEEIKDVISSMLTQTMRAQEIRINIPNESKRTGEEYVIPNWLSKTPLTIVRCIDFGPATKYIPTLEHFSKNQKILIFDDDSIMPENLIETFGTLSIQYPDIALTSSGRKLVGNPHQDKLTQQDYCWKVSWGTKTLCSLFGLSHPKEMKSENELEYVDMVFGWVGYLITPTMVELSDLQNSEYPPDAFFVDDVVMSACLLKNGTPIAIGKKLQYPKYILKTLFETIFKNGDKEALVNTDNKTHSHDVVMEKYFQQFWKFLDPV